MVVGTIVGLLTALSGQATPISSIMVLNTAEQPAEAACMSTDIPP